MYEFDAQLFRDRFEDTEAQFRGTPIVVVPGVYCRDGHHVTVVRAVEQAIELAQVANRAERCEYAPIPVMLDVRALQARLMDKLDPLADLRALPETEEEGT